jgi:hypothetical protein
MRIRLPILVTLLSVGIAYGAYPYVTLYRLNTAIQAADAKTLESLVDWPSVREGIKEDICDFVVDDPNPASGSKLPPFGASFMRGITSSTVDQAVTPQALLAATGTLPAKPADAQHSADIHVNWAFFDSPTGFTVSLQAAGRSEPVRLEMELRNGDWRIQRVWLPPELLGNPPART